MKLSQELELRTLVLIDIEAREFAVGSIHGMESGATKEAIDGLIAVGLLILEKAIVKLLCNILETNIAIAKKYNCGPLKSGIIQGAGSTLNRYNQKEGKGRERL